MAGIFSRLAGAFQQLDAGHIISLAALGLSLGAAVVNGWFLLAGSDVRLLHPDRMMIYHARAGRTDVLNVVVPVRLVNKAVSNFGDTAISVKLSGRLRSGRTVSFGTAADSVVTVWSDTPPDSEACRLPTRCFSVADLRFIQTPAALVDVPGSSSRQNDLAFTLAERPCPSRACDFYGYAQSFRSLPELAEIELIVELADDGVRRVRCSLPAFRGAEMNYLARNRFLTVTPAQCFGGLRLLLSDLKRSFY